MATYKNDYKKSEDFVLWELHEIRNKMAEKGLSSSDINRKGRTMVERYGLSKLKKNKISS